MSASEQQKYGKFEVVRGDLYAQPRRWNRRPAATGFSTAEYDLDRDMHDLFTALVSVDGTVPSRAIQQVREHQQWPWRVFARRLREAVEAGVPTTQLYEITHRFNQYVAQLAARRSTPFRKGAA